MLLLFALACTPSPYRVGMRAFNEGRFIEAADVWLEALREDPEAPKPRQALREHALDAWNQRLDIAREYEASRRYADSVAAYEALLDYAKALDEVGLLAFSTADAIAELDAVTLAWAMDERAKGTVAYEAGDYATAVKHYDAARALRTDLIGLDAEQGDAYADWARQDLEQHRYHDAAEHYHRAFALTRDPTHGAWAAAVEAALGRYALERGACRTAVAHFERAGDIPDLDADRVRALDCSRLGLLFEPVEEAITYQGRALSVGTMLLDRIQREIDAGGSRFIRILNPEILGSIANPPEKRVKITVRINQAAVDPRRETEVKASAEGVRVVPCDPQTLIYEPDAVCTETVQVDYLLHQLSQTVRLAGSVQIVSLNTGEQATRPLEVWMTHDTTRATDFELFEDGTAVPVEIGTEAMPGRIELPEAIVALDRQPLPLPSGEEMLVEAVRTLAAEAARAILEEVDHEEEPPPPRSLTVRSPVLSPSDIELVPPR